MVSLNRYYERYDSNDQVVIENLLIYKKNLLEIEAIIPKDLYSKLEIRKQLAHSEAETIRNKVIEDMLPIVSI